MDASDMGLANDRMMRRLNALVEAGFDFEDLLEAEAERAAGMEELSSVIALHQQPAAPQDVRLPHLRLELCEIPALVDAMLDHAFPHPAAAVSLGIRLTHMLRSTDAAEAKSKVREFLKAIAGSEDDDLTLKLVADVCAKELE